jgi:hypothetical protein
MPFLIQARTEALEKFVEKGAPETPETRHYNNERRLRKEGIDIGKQPF